MFSLREVQTGREISEDEVRTINFILKKRAKRFVAAAERDWLYPERTLKTTTWNMLGDHFFLMPDPRKVPFSTKSLVGFEDGTSWGIDEYGRPPWRDDPAEESLREKEWDTFHRHRAMWKEKFGELSREEMDRYW